MLIAYQARTLFTKTVSFLLAVFLLLTSAPPIFAQEGSQSAVRESTSGLQGDSFQSAEISNAPLDLPGGQMMAMSGGSIDQQGGSLYVSDSGILSGAPDVDAQTGAYTYTHPIVIPPGRNGLAPEVALNYNSNNRELDSVFGYGWSVPMLQIYRLNKTGIADVYTSDDFYSELDGELVSNNGTDFAAEFDKGDFRDYEFDGSRWIVVDKSGTRYSFGSTTASQFVDTSSSTRVFAWYLDEIRDTNDNYIKYTYYKSGGKVYPNTIVYTGHGSIDGIYTINFLRETRPDTHVSYTPGFVSTTTERISEIRVNVAGSWVRTYEFDYGTGENGTRSLLTSITESSSGDGGTVTLPATTFAYSEIAPSSQAWSDDNSFTVPERITGTHQGQDMGVRFFDVNGDGYADLTIYKNTSLLAPDNVVEKIYLNEGSEWVEDTTWSFPQPVAKMAFTGRDLDGWHDMGARFVDVNADGYTDILWSINQCFTGWTCQNFQKTYINNKVDGWTESTTTFALPSDVYFAGGGQTGGGNELADVNGDGLVDIVKATRYTINGGGLYRYTKKTYLNTGSGWEEAGDEWDSPEVFEDQFKDAGTRLVDLNGDGLIDIIKHTDTDYSDPQRNDVPEDTAYLNTGEGWVAAPQWKSPIPFLYKFLNYGKKTKSTRLMDINGDGLTDIFADDRDSLGGNLQKIIINTGEGWSDQTANWTFDPDLYLNYSYSNNGYWITDAGVRFVDFDGDNMVDIVKAGPTDNHPNHPVYINEILTHKGDVPDLLTKVTTAQGGTITAEYMQSAQYKVDDERANKAISINLDTVAKVTHDNGFANVHSTTYFYEDGHYFHASTTNRQFAGFGKVTGSNDLGTTTWFYHQGNSNNASSSESGDTEAKIGLVYQVEVTDDVGNLFSRNRINWGTDDTTVGEFVYLASTVKQQYDGDADHKDSATAYTYDSDHGSVLTMTEYGEVFGSSDGTFTDLGTDKRTTIYEYATNTSAVVVPKLERLLDHSSTTVRESTFTYDDQSYGTVTTGNLTKQEDLVSSGNYIETTWTYDSYGNVLSETDPRNHTTLYDYDAYNLYVASTTNAVGHNTQYEYDYASGQIGTTTDPNGNVYVTTYDGFGRPLTEYAPDPQTGNQVLVSEYAYTDTAGAVSVKQTQHLSSTLNQDRYTYLDGFGQTVQERVEAEGANEFRVRDFIYGDNGLLEKESLPYFSSGSGKTTATTNNDLLSVYAYDALGRVTSALTAVGTTNTAYDQWTETVTDTNGNDKNFTYDAFGRLAQVTEHEGTNSYHTNYDWDARGNLTKITDAEGNVRNITYDNLSRRTSLEDLHDPADNTFGTWTFAYDATGNLSSTTDPNGQVVNYTYDDINRILTEDFIGQSGTEVTYQYDACTNGVGQLCLVANRSATTSYTYTPNSLVASESKVIDDTTYTTSYAYDRAGNQTLITYPDNSEVQYTYNKANRVEGIEQRESGGSFASLVDDADYGPHGQITYLRQGNGAETTRTYDAAKLYRLSNITTIATTTYGVGGPGAELAQTEAELELGLLELPSTLTSESIAEPVADEPTTPAESAVETNDVVTEETRHAEEAAEPAPVTETEDEIVAEPEEVAQSEATNTASSTDTDPATEIATTTDEVVFGLPPALTEPVIDEAGTSSTATATSTDTTLIASSTEAAGTTTQEISTSTPALVPNPKPTIASSTSDKIVAPTAEELDQLAAAIVTPSLATPPMMMLSSGGTTTEFITIQPDQNDGKDTYYGTVYWTGGNPNSDGMYIGGWGDSYYSFIEFDTSSLPASSTIVSAEIHLYNELSFGSANNAILERVTEPWTEAGVTRANNPASVSIGMGWQIVPAGWWIADVTDLAKDWVDGSAPNYGVRVLGQYNSNQHQKLFATSDELTHTDRRPKLVVGVVNHAPTAPSDLQTNAETNPVDLPDADPSFSAIYHDDDVGDRATHYQLQVDDTADFSSIFWDTGKTAMATTAAGFRSPAISYTGNPLATSTTYHWRIKFWDDGGAEGDWSTTTATFSLAGSATTTPPTFPPFHEVVQHLTYTYDPVGNITKVVDASDTKSAATTTYTYDDLYRLKTAVTMNATSAPYNRSYTYSSLGNLLTKSDTGSYTYAGTNYANPHAATTIGGETHTYDQNGNLTAAGSDTFTWNYRNELIETVTTDGTTTYTYDHTGQRVQKTTDSTTTLYPFAHYETTNTGSTTKHIYLGDQLIATIEDATPAPTVYYNHLDHLHSTRVVTDASGYITQELDYYPYGDTRIDNEYGTHRQHIQHTGNYKDVESALIYRNARYQDGSIGKFISQDPMFLAVGGPDLADKMEVPEIANQEKRNAAALRVFLSDPQLANSYSYSRNNPITLKDPNGNCGGACVLAAAVLAGLFLDVNTAHAPADQEEELTSSPLATRMNIAGLLVGGPKSVGKGIVGTSFGKLGTAVDNSPGKITGFTSHGLNQTISRGVSPSALINTTKNPTVVLQQAGGNRLYLTDQAAVVLNKKGQVVTTYTSKEFKPHVQDVLTKAKEAEKKRE